MKPVWLMPFVLICGMSLSARGASPDVDAFLAAGKFDEGITALESHLQKQPKDDNARFGLGVIQFVQTIQRLTTKLDQYGPRNGFDPDAKSATDGELLTYPRLRQITQEWLNDLARVEKTLAIISSDDVKLPLHVTRIRLDLAREGGQSLMIMPFMGRWEIPQTWRDADLEIAFDRADVEWLRGYCHLMAGLGEIGLAYDGQELFDVFAHRLFVRVKTPHTFLLDEPRERQPGSWFRFEDLADAIAAIHVLRFPVTEPKRTAVALSHFEQTLACSRKMWKLVLLETDDDREWIPSPKQKGALNVPVSQEMVDQWSVALDETESILQGKKLLPFWRGKTTRGVNLRKAFLEPRPLDVVLWVQGAAATPYLEEGELTRPDTWQRINQAFRGEFLGFSLWFN